MDRNEAVSREEAVQKRATAGRLSIAHAEDLYDSFFEKPVVPPCVADWYEGHKDEFEINLYREVCQTEKNYNCGGLTDFQEWLISGKTNPFSVLVNMHQFGYEVEKEPRYMVRIKGVSEINRYLNKECDEGFLFADSGESEDYRTKFTRKELEKGGFGEVFDNPMFEVKEVE